MSNQKLTVTSVSALAATGAFCAAAAFILVRRFYGILGPIPLSVPIFLWGMAVICVVLSVTVKRRIDRNQIGQDRSQLSPINVAVIVIVAKTCAWGGAIFGGIYLGLGLYIVPRASELLAAAEDAPTVIFSGLGGIALAAAGWWLETNTKVPPEQDGERMQRS